MKLKKITIEGMHNVIRKTYDLSNITYLFGKNGVGKSTVMQAIQLALLGYIPGTAKTKSELFRHANNHTMAVSLFIDDTESEVSIRRIWTSSGSTVNATVDIKPIGYSIEKIVEELELPIFNFGEFVDMTANKLKDWFIEFLPSMEVKTDWDIVLKEKLVIAGLADIDEDLISSSVKEINGYKLSGVDEIRKANDYFKAMLSMKKKEVDRVQGTIQSLIYYDDIDSAESEDDIQSELNAVRTTQILVRDRDRAIAQNESIKLRLSKLPKISSESYETDKDYIKIQSDIEKLHTDELKCSDKFTIEYDNKKNIESKIVEHTNVITEFKSKISAKEEIISSGNVCPFTKKSCESIQTLLDDYRNEIESYASEVAENNEEISKLRKSLQKYSEECDRLLENREIIRKKISKLELEASDIKHNYETVSILKSQIVDVPEVNVDYDITKRIQELEDKLVKLKANQRYSDTIDKLTTEKYKIENEIASYKYWIELTGVNGLQNITGESNPFIGLEDSMNIYLKAVFGESVKSKFNLVAKANSFSFGIERNHSYIPFNLLSSGEKCMYTLALMLSLVNVSKSPLKIVMVDDLLDHLDNANAEKLFESLQKVKDIQMIFAGVKDIKGDFVVEVTE